MTEDPYRLAAEKVRADIAERAEELKAHPAMAEIVRKKHALNALETLMGEQITSLADILGLEAESPQASELQLKPDEYYSLEPLEAAKRYLKRRGEARSFSEILAAIRSAGCRADSEERLRESLTRSTYEVAKVGQDYFGLTEFYGIKRGGKKRKFDNGEPEKNESSEAKEEGAEALRGEGEPNV
jgi:hypothetical protein